MKIKDLQPGMTVYDAHKYKMGNTKITSVGIWPVRIIEVNIEKETVMASWNMNPAKTYSRQQWAKWRKEKPVLIRSGFADRLATRDEIKAMKAKEA